MTTDGSIFEEMATVAARHLPEPVMASEPVMLDNRVSVHAGNVAGDGTLTVNVMVPRDLVVQIAQASAGANHSGGLTLEKFAAATVKAVAAELQTLGPDYSAFAEEYGALLMSTPSER